MKDFRIDDLLALPSLGLRFVAGRSGLERTIRSIHTIDLDRPGRYLFPGELVLTNGLWLERVSPESWVGEVDAVGISAVGFGVTDLHADVPDELREACETRGLPLLSIPAEVSFTSISDAVQAGLAEDDRQGLRAQLARTRHLVRVLAEGAGHKGLLEVLRRETSLDATFVTAGGRTIASVGQPPTQSALRAAAAALRRGTLPEVIEPGLTVVGLVDNGPSSPGLVVRASLAALSDAARLAVEQVAAYAAVEDQRIRAKEAWRDALGQELIDLAWSGELTPSVFSARMIALGLEPRLAILVIACSSDPRALTDALDDQPHVIGNLSRTTILILQGDDRADHLGALAAHLVEMGDDPILGGSQPVSGSGGLRLALAEALATHSAARSRPPGDRVVRDLVVGSHELLLDFLDRRLTESFRTSVLSPIEGWDKDHASDLVPTLSAFLGSGGRWRATAEMLHIHPNTLRYRLRRIEQLTGRDLDTTSDRVDLWLAMHV